MVKKVRRIGLALLDGERETLKTIMLSTTLRRVLHALAETCDDTADAACSADDRASMYHWRNAAEIVRRCAGTVEIGTVSAKME